MIFQIRSKTDILQGKIHCNISITVLFMHFFLLLFSYAILYTQYIKNVRRCQAFSGVGKAAGSDREKKRQDREEKDRNAEKAKTAEKRIKSALRAQITDMEKKEKRRIVSGVRLPDDRENAFPGIKGEIRK